MLGLFLGKTERKVRELERIVVAMERAARADDLLALHQRTREQLKVLRWINEHGDWSEEKLVTYLRGRGVARAFCDPAVNELLSRKVPESEYRHGLASSGIC